MKRLLILFFCTLFLLSSCKTPAIDTSIYTSEKPYVVNNISLEDDICNMSTIYAIHGTGPLKSLKEKLSGYAEIAGNKYTVCVARKVSSKSYYWESGENIVAYTDTIITVRAKIAGYGIKYEDLNVGDTIHIVESFAESPTNEISFSEISIIRNRYVGNNLDTSVRNDYNCMFWNEKPPVMKFDTDYLVILDADYYVQYADYSCVRGEPSCMDTVEISTVPVDGLEGACTKYLAYELSRSAYLEQQKCAVNECNHEPTQCHYYRMVKEAWQTYKGYAK